VFFLGVLTPVEAAGYPDLEAARAAAGHAALRELEAMVQ
jgi:hypothetical protein